MADNDDFKIKGAAIARAEVGEHAYRIPSITWPFTSEGLLHEREF